MSWIDRVLRRPRAVPLTEVAHESDETRRMMEALLREKAAAAQPVIRQPFAPGVGSVVAIPYCRKDVGAVLDLLRWTSELEDSERLPAVLLCAPAGIEDEAVEAVRQVAGKAYHNVNLLRTSFDLPREGWPTGTVWSFMHIAEYCRKHRLDFWLNEPDCIPLRAGWFQDLEREYQECELPFLGFIEPAHPGGHYPRHMTGNGFYHWETFKFIRADRMDLAWDVAMAEYLTPRCHQSRLFHQEFGPLDHPPTFPTRESVARIPRGAAVFHRNKDGSLIAQLRDGAR